MSLPTPPQRSDGPTTFADRGDAFMAALPAFESRMEDIDANVIALEAMTVASAAAAVAASTTAVAATGAAMWVSGTFAVGDVRWSPLTGLSYRCKTAGTRATDPSIDLTNWFQLSVNAENIPGLVPIGGSIFASFTSPDYTDSLGVGWLRNGFVVDTNAVAAAALDDFAAVTYSNFFEHATLPVGKDWSAIAVSPSGVFCALPTVSGNVAATSPDGVTWTQRTLPSSDIWVAVACSPTTGVFCAITGNTTSARNVAATSPDGITWTARTLPSTSNWTDITCSPAGLFCAIAYNGTVAATSLDGITWTARTLPVSAYWIAIAVNPSGLFCAVSGTGGTAATSPDGATWTQRSLGVNDSWKDIACSPTTGLFCALRDGNGFAGNFFTSPDGITWTMRGTSNPALGLNKITVSPSGLFLAFADNTNNPNRIYSSPDGITWTQRSLVSSESFYTKAAAVSPSGLFCITTRNGSDTSTTVFTSTDPTSDVAMSWGTAGASGGQYQFVRYK